MIVVFGPLFTDVQMRVDTLLKGESNSKVSARAVIPGGKTASQAIAAARAGASVCVIGAVGHDEDGQRILETLKRQGVDTNRVAGSFAPTGISVTIADPERRRQRALMTGAVPRIDQIEKGFFNDRMVFLAQTGFEAGENLKLLTMAKEAGATTIMNLAPYLDLSQKTLDVLDYLIVNQVEARKLAEKLGLKVEHNAFQLAQGLAKQGNLNCIVTLGSKGCIGVTRDNTGWSVEALPVDDKVLDLHGAEDSYCGTLAAGILAGLPLPRAMKRACVAASLTCMRPGIVEAFPTKAEVESRLNETKDPEQRKLA